MKPIIKVMPEKYSEKNLMTSVMDMIGEYIPISQTKTTIDEQVFWTKFEEFDSNTSNPTKCSNKSLTFQFLVSIGTCKGFYMWGIPLDGKATLLFAERNACTIDCKLLPTPCSTVDKFASRRPILAICDILSCGVYRWQVRLVSLLGYEPVRAYTFESKPLCIDANTSFIVIARSDSLTILSSITLEEHFTIKGVTPTKWAGGLPRSTPFTLGTRWLAFADVKPVYQHLSHCGDASSDESEPLTSTVMNVNKRIWDSLSSLVSPATTSAGDLQRTAVSSGQTWSPNASGPAAGQKEQTPSTCTAGYVTVVDLVYLTEAQPVVATAAEATPEQCVLTGTRYLSVHDYNGAGCLVAHFMAHRWANVALLKFDPTGSLLFTACSRGHSFNLFRLSNHPCDSRQTAVHHLYILERGTIPCEVVDATFSQDSRWLSVSSNHGTTHVFPITPYGGAVTVRTHTRPHVVNRTSRYHRTSGLEEYHLTRPQRERGGLDSSVASTTTASSASACGDFGHGGGGGGGVACCTTVLGTGRCCSYPPKNPGSLPSCPHLSVHLQTTSQAIASYCGDSEFPPDACGQPNAAFPKGLCACPSNAKFNTTNPRLPPYPEPCQLRPEARLRPHNAGGATGGVASAALEAATGVASSVAKSSVTASTGYSQLSYWASASAGGTGSGAGGGHRGPCVHFPRGVPVQQLSAPPRYSTSMTSGAVTYHHHQPLPTVETLGSSAYHLPMAHFSGVIMAAQFGSPVCFLPRPGRHNTAFDPYGGKSRVVDSLFILTGDLYMVEYDLCVFPAETHNYGETLYQDGSIRLECAPVGEWNLRTDAIMLPPFSGDHPWLITTTTSQSLHPKSPVSGREDGSGGHSQLRLVNVSSSPLLFEVDSCRDLDATDKAPTPVGESSPQQTVPALASSPPEGWSAEDVACYWYSQVEVTTHLGPLRRIWMGPQFSFHTYATRSAPPGLELAASDDLPSGLTGLHPGLASVLSSSSAVSSLMGSPDDYYSGQLLANTTAGHHHNSTGSVSKQSSLLAVGEPLVGEPGVRYPRGDPRQGTGQKQRRLRKTRTQSGEAVLSSQPISIVGADADMRVFIEGGSYQDSSLGSSLSSLIGRNLDDVSQFIAEAMQDEETQFPGVDAGQVVLRTVPLSNVQPTLSEADFPSQDTSPLSKAEGPQFDDLVVPVATTPPPAPCDASDQEKTAGNIQLALQLPVYTPGGGSDSNSSGKETFLDRADTGPPKVVKRVKTKPSASGKRSHKTKKNTDSLRKQSSLPRPCLSGPSSLASSPRIIGLPDASNRFLSKLAAQPGDDSSYQSSSAFYKVAIRRSPTEPNVRLCVSTEAIPLPSESADQSTGEQIFDAE